MYQVPAQAFKPLIAVIQNKCVSEVSRLRKHIMRKELGYEPDDTVTDSRWKLINSDGRCFVLGIH